MFGALDVVVIGSDQVSAWMKWFTPPSTWNDYVYMLDRWQGWDSITLAAWVP